MIDALLSLPTLLGCLVFMVLTAAIGLTVYFATSQLIARRQSDAAIAEIKDAAGNLLRVVGWLFCLLLSLTFTDVVRDLTVIDTAIKREAVAIADTFLNLRRFSPEQARSLRNLLIDYTDSVIHDDWPALASDGLSERPDALMRHLGDALLELTTTDSAQEALHARVIADMDLASDTRLTRLQQARERPPPTLIVVFFGYLVTMVCFGVYRPSRALVGMMSLYAVFVGVVFYLVLAISDPFQGAFAVDPGPLEDVLEMIRAQGG